MLNFETAHEKSFTQISFEWLKGKEGHIKESTYCNYFSILKKHILPYFSDIDISKIDSAELQAFFMKLFCEYKSKTVRDILTVLKQIFNYAQKEGYCGNLSDKIALPKATPHIMKIISESEQKQLEQFLTDNITLEKLGIIICLYTGIRLGEVCALQWGDIDFNNKTIKIMRTVQRISVGNGCTRFLIDVPKTANSVREIPLPSSIMNYIHKFRRSDESAYLITGTKSFMQPRTYQNKFKVFLKKSGISQSFHFHTLRHTFASRAVELGFDPKSLSEILGHANVNITLNRYVHSSMTQKRRNMLLFDSFV